MVVQYLLTVAELGKRLLQEYGGNGFNVKRPISVPGQQYHDRFRRKIPNRLVFEFGKMCECRKFIANLKKRNVMKQSPSLVHKARRENLNIQHIEMINTSSLQGRPFLVDRVRGRG